ncbi:hypothetical protein XTG_002196 [Xanthomonas euroxanthea]|nr:hypothetical protein XTG_002196 [Xanthomonas euroxanthea]
MEEIQWAATVGWTICRGLSNVLRQSLTRLALVWINSAEKNNNLLNSPQFSNTYSRLFAPITFSEIFTIL